MNVLSWVLLGAVAACSAGAVRHIIKNKGKGSCSGCCADCAEHCAQRKP